MPHGTTTPPNVFLNFSLAIAALAMLLAAGPLGALATTTQSGEDQAEPAQLRARGCSLQTSDPKARAESWENAVIAMKSLYEERVGDLYDFKDDAARLRVASETMGRPRTAGYARGILPDRRSVLCVNVVLDYDPARIVALAKSHE